MSRIFARDNESWEEVTRMLRKPAMMRALVLLALLAGVGADLIGPNH